MTLPLQPSFWGTPLRALQQLVSLFLFGRVIHKTGGFYDQRALLLSIPTIWAPKKPTKLSHSRPRIENTSTKSRRLAITLCTFTDSDTFFGTMKQLVETLSICRRWTTFNRSTLSETFHGRAQLTTVTSLCSKNETVTSSICRYCP